EQDPWHRFHIARALGKLRNPKAVEMLADVIRTDTADKLYRTRSAIRELGVIGGERAAEALYFAMEQHGAAIHGDAYVALAEMGDTSAVIPLAAMLIDTNSSGSRFDVRHFPFREEAASALAKLGDPRVIPHLISTLRHEEEPVGKAAQQALEKLTGQNFGRDLAKWQKWWRANRERLLSAHNSAAPFAPKHSAK
ncbi:MAG: HEAT repeat domain-containing protein, partial [Planctomycetes bacterium]|nr:HEAT repeat domain-containing protein [Planctomycetota bacterium]